MALNVLVIDTTTGRYIDSGQVPASPSGFTKDDFTTGGGGATDFVLTNSTLTAIKEVVALVNGVEKREGTNPEDFTRNVALNKIVFNYNIPSGNWVRIRVY